MQDDDLETVENPGKGAVYGMGKGSDWGRGEEGEPGGEAASAPPSSAAGGGAYWHDEPPSTGESGIICEEE